MRYSLKPYLLDSLLTWAVTCGYTPVLIVRKHPYNGWPDVLQTYDQVAFYLGPHFVTDKDMTTEGLSFETVIAPSGTKERVFLTPASWLALTIRETGDTFLLDFEENQGGMPSPIIGTSPAPLAPDNGSLFPRGIFLHHGPQSIAPGLQHQILSEGPRGPSVTPLFKKPQLKLVVNNDAQRAEETNTSVLPSSSQQPISTTDTRTTPTVTLFLTPRSTNAANDTNNDPTTHG